MLIIDISVWVCYVDHSILDYSIVKQRFTPRKHKIVGILIEVYNAELHGFDNYAAV